MKKKHLSSKEIANSLIFMAVLSIGVTALIFMGAGTMFLFLSGAWFGLAIER